MSLFLTERTTVFYHSAVKYDVFLCFDKGCFLYYLLCQRCQGMRAAFQLDCSEITLKQRVMAGCQSIHSTMPDVMLACD